MEFFGILLLPLLDDGNIKFKLQRHLNGHNYFISCFLRGDSRSKRWLGTERRYKYRRIQVQIYIFGDPWEY